MTNKSHPLSSLLIRKAAEADMPVLDQHGPIEGLSKCEHETVVAPDALYLVALLDGTFVGHGYLRLSGFQSQAAAERFGHYAVLNSFAVWPAALRKAGIGSVFLTEFEKGAVESGMDRIALGVFADNVRAIKFYEHRGYVLHSDFCAGVSADHPDGWTVMTKQL
jgi:ribosomal protein S18 acetylase RimI-like enzyme